MENTPEEYVAKMVEVFREVRRVLRPDGSLWLNLASTYASNKVESQDYTMREDLNNGERAYALRELGLHLVKESEVVPPMRETDAPAEQGMPRVLRLGEEQARELSGPAVPDMRQGVHGPQVPSGEGAGTVLLSGVRSLGQPDPEEAIPNGQVPDLREMVQQTSGGDTEKQGCPSLLQSEVLVQLQPARQSLSVGRGTKRPDEPGRSQMAQGGFEAGQAPLPNLPCGQALGGSPHPPFWAIFGEALGREQRDYPLSRVPRQIQESGIGLRGDVGIHGLDSGHGLAYLRLRKADIPSHLLQFFRPSATIKPKDEIDIPNMVCEALRSDGWYRRATIIWQKSNPMPESVIDRPTKAHEYIFLLSKNERYYYDADAIREEATTHLHDKRYGPGAPGRDRTKEPWNQQAPYKPHKGFKSLDTTGGRNKRTVWTVATKPFPEAHFATFPEKLIEPCILAGTSPQACPKCGAPWTRITQRDKVGPVWNQRGERTGQHLTGDLEQGRGKFSVRYEVEVKTTGWHPTCSCEGNDGSGRCIVLDPFAGAGTTLLVAERYGRDSIGYELNPKYCEIIRRRLGAVQQRMEFGGAQ